jgi:hypothetical protein
MAPNRIGSEIVKQNCVNAMRLVALLIASQAFADADDVAQDGGSSAEMANTLGSLHFAVSPAALDTVSDEDAWRVDLNTWLWMMGIDGDVGAGARTASVDASFIDVLEASDSLIGLAGRLEVGKGKWAGFVDGLYNKIDVEDASGPLGIADVDVTMKMGLVDFGLMYRLGEWPCEHTKNLAYSDVTLDVYAGARYTDLSLEVDPAALASVERDKDWIDPIVGAKVTLPLAEHFHLTAWGDIGGFGVSSDFTWSATAVLGYDFTLFDHPATLYAGYRALGQDFSDGSGTSRFEWDVIMHGPILGFSLFF